MPNSSPTPTQWIGMASTLSLATILFLLMCKASWVIHSGMPGANWRAIGVLTFGVACGWLAGTIASPAGSSEWDRFVKFGTIIGTFLSGYVLSKADTLITLFMTPAKWRAHESFTFLVLMWLTGLVLSTMATFVMRSYLVPPTTEGRQRAAVENAEKLLQLARIESERLAIEQDNKRKRDELAREANSPS